MKNLILMKILVVLSLVILPLYVIFHQKDQDAYANASSSKYTVTAPTIHVRENADISSKIIGNVHHGDMFTLIKSKDGWDQIKLSGNQIGWVYHTYVTPTEEIKATVGAIVLNVRESPSLSSKVTGKLKMGTKITVNEEQASWAKVVSVTGVQGWVYKYYITKDAPVSNPSINTVPSQIKLSQSTQPSSSDAGANDQSKNSNFTLDSHKPLKGKTIVLDPGHGGNDDGTTSISGTPEKALTLETAQAVTKKLQSAGANVIMTRTHDTYIPLKERADLSTQNHADAFISFHYNWSSDPSVSGLIDFYYKQAKDDPLASIILNDVAKTTGLNTEGAKFDNLDVLRTNTQPSTLIELGFLSNKHDDTLVESNTYRDQVAQGVYMGLLDYFSNKK